jgi:hypothetical protein
MVELLPEDIRLLKLGARLGTSRRILEAYEKCEFFGLIVYGPQGIGKSTYMLKVLKEVYGSWDLALKHVVFSLDDLIDIIKTEERILCIGWDDAGIHGHKYKYFRHKESVELISAWLDAIRTQVAGLIITTVNPFNLLKPVRTSLGMRYGKVIVNKEEYDYRAVKVYEMTVLPNGKHSQDVYIRTSSKHDYQTTSTEIHSYA